MVNLDPQLFGGAFKGRRVLVTGHTGFKGAWLCEWLLNLGAEVCGYSLAPVTQPSLFQLLRHSERLRHVQGDLADRDQLANLIRELQPDFVFHLAAKALVRESYEQPVETYGTNVMGTIHLLEALRPLQKSCAAIFVTSDKCYENREWVHGYREEDPLGGWDPYSSSKAAAEVAISAWRRSFFRNHPVRIASARAGNVIGGGDWSLDRIVPDCVRALSQGQAILVRNKTATRPWQHVLEPLSGYLSLAARLSAAQPAQAEGLASAFNFGPGHDSNRTVAYLVAEILTHWPGSWVDKSDPKAVHEAHLLQLSIDKAHALLSWSPVWKFSDAVEHTVNWYRQIIANPKLTQACTAEQIQTYARAASQLLVPWALPTP
jgi:CDP-glucose 4,6-dehydratase